MISEEKRGFLSPRQYSGLSLPELTVVIDRISEIHAATTAMFLANALQIEELSEDLSQKNAFKEDADLVFRTLAHFLRRVPGYLDKHHLICKYRQILVEHVTTKQNHQK